MKIKLIILYFGILAKVLCQAPANDDCANAIAFPPVLSDGSCSYIEDASTFGATNSGVTPTGACTSNAGGTDDDIWYKFTATNTTMYLECNWGYGASDNYYQVFSGACGATMTSVYCNDEDFGHMIGGLTNGQNYYLRVYTRSSPNRGVTHLCLRNVTGPPANDECANAITLTPSASGECNPTFGSFTAATASAQSGQCGTATQDDDDVWYKFTAINDTQLIYLSNNYGDNVSWVLKNNSCTGSVAHCGTNNSDIATGLTVGQQYFLRIFSLSTSTNQTGSFNLCVVNPSPVSSNSDCATAIEFCSDTNFVKMGTTIDYAEAGNNYGCLTTQRNPYWYTFGVNDAGSINFNLDADRDVDYAIWGPYTSSDAALNQCGSLPAPVSCSYSVTSHEDMDLANANVGDYFVLLICNRSNVANIFEVDFDEGASTGGIGCPILLGIDLISFYATFSNNLPNLQWQTKNEERNDYFLVQRTIDGKKWETIKMIDSKGTSDIVNNYSFVDDKAPDSDLYYRLVQIDLDGASSLSDPIFVNYQTNDEVLVYPSPADKFVKISLKKDIPFKIMMYSMDGKQLDVDFNTQNSQLNTSMLSPGVYTLKIYTSSDVFEKIIIKK